MISSDALEIREATVRHQDEVILLLILQAIAAAQLSDVIATSSEALLVALEAVGWTKSPRELARLLHKLRAEERLKFESWFRVEEGEDERE
jgi:hypothetical protein